MSNNYFPIPRQGQELKECHPENLSIQKAQEIAKNLLSNVMNWVSFVNSVQHFALVNDGEIIVAETIVFDAEIELPQICKNEIERIERIAVTFHPEDKTYPKVFALRENFPDVLHLNLEAFEFPCSLCIFEEAYEDVKLKWTAVGFIERIRRWLADTATGSLHRDDQPLENLLIGTNTPLILPSRVFSTSEQNPISDLEVFYYKSENDLFFIAQDLNTNGEIKNLLKERGAKFAFISILGSPQPQTKIRQTPNNLCELNGFLKTAKIDFLTELRQVIKNIDYTQENRNLGVIILVRLPITKNGSKIVEKVEIRAFVCLDEDSKFSNVKTIGEKIGLWEINNGQVGGLLRLDEDKTGEEIKLLMLNPGSMLSRDNAPIFAGSKPRFAEKIVAVGLGALGSQVFINLAKTADGEWILIDKDILLPHNFVRHAAYGPIVGYSKSEIMAHFANTTIESPNIANFIVADALNPREKEIEIKAAFSQSKVILDCSASVAVARHLGLDVDSTARRISLFLNPSGTDIVLLAEDGERKIPVDWLEMQYYRLLKDTDELQDHLQLPNNQIRYLSGCREVSSQISSDEVALCAAIGSKSLRQVFNQNDAAIFLWRVNGDGEVQKHSVKPSVCITEKVNGWVIRTDEYLLNKLSKIRKDKLPTETGGVLIGSYDMQRRIIYVVDLVLPPPDSIETLNSFTRGSYGLKPIVDKIKQITLENLQYIGEWHSHPLGYSSNPSDDDKKLLQTVKNNLQQDGKPGLMLIVGEPQNTWHII